MGHAARGDTTGIDIASENSPPIDDDDDSEALGSPIPPLARKGVIFLLPGLVCFDGPSFLWANRLADPHTLGALRIFTARKNFRNFKTLTVGRAFEAIRPGLLPPKV